GVSHWSRHAEATEIWPCTSLSHKLGLCRRAGTAGAVIRIVGIDNGRHRGSGETRSWQTGDGRPSEVHRAWSDRWKIRARGRTCWAPSPYRRVILPVGSHTNSATCRQVLVHQGL